MDLAFRLKAKCFMKNPITLLLRSQYSGGGVIFLVGIMGDRMIGRFKVPRTMKTKDITSFNLIKDVLIDWLDEFPIPEFSKVICIHSKALLHNVEGNKEVLAALDLKDFNEVVRLFCIL